MSGPLFVIDMRPFGFERVTQMFAGAGAALLAAREYALASTAKMIRTAVRRAAQSPGGSFGLGWPALSPFTGRLAENKGAAREAFQFAQKTWAGFGEAVDFSGQSRVRQLAFRRRVRVETGRRSRMTKNQRALEQGRVAGGRILGTSRRSPFQKVAGMVDYQLDQARGLVTVGFFRGAASTTPVAEVEDLVAKVQAGFSTTITSRMRRFFFAIGLPITGGQSAFHSPARDWIGAVKDRLAAAIPEHFRQKFLGRFMPAFERVGYSLGEVAQS